MSTQSMQTNRLRVEKFLTEAPLIPPHVGFVIQDNPPVINHSFPLHCHPAFCEIYYHKNGDFTYMIEDTPWELHNGDIFYIPSGVRHTIRTIHGNNPGRIWIGIADSLLTYTMDLIKDLNFVGFPDLTRPFSLKASKFTRTELAESFLRVGQECEKEQPGWEMKARCATVELLIDIARAYYEEYVSTEEKNQYLVERIQHYIERHLGEALDRTTICQLFFISPSTLSHSFQTHMHMSFSQYVTAKRMQYAAQLLQKDGVSAQEASLMCGYEEYTSFFRAFKKFHGYSPKEWIHINQTTSF